MRDKYRDLRHTKFGKAKYGPYDDLETEEFKWE